MKTNPNDPVSPYDLKQTQRGTWMLCENYPALTKREHFAALNMAAMIHYSIMHKLDWELCAEDSVIAADALIEALNRADSQA